MATHESHFYPRNPSIPEGSDRNDSTSSESQLSDLSVLALKIKTQKGVIHRLHTDLSIIAGNIGPSLPQEIQAILKKDEATSHPRKISAQALNPEAGIVQNQISGLEKPAFIFTMQQPSNPSLGRPSLSKDKGISMQANLPARSFHLSQMNQGGGLGLGGSRLPNKSFASFQGSNVGFRSVIAGDDILNPFMDIAVAEAVSKYSIMSLSNQQDTQQTKLLQVSQQPKPRSRANSISVSHSPSHSNLKGTVPRRMSVASIGVRHSGNDASSLIDVKVDESSRKDSDAYPGKQMLIPPVSTLPRRPSLRVRQLSFEEEKAGDIEESPTKPEVLTKPPIITQTVVQTPQPAAPPAPNPTPPKNESTHQERLSVLQKLGKFCSKPYNNGADIGSTKAGSIQDTMTQNFFIHPNSLFKIAFDFFMSVIYIIVILVIPVVASFQNIIASDQIHILSIFLTVIFILDTCVIFNTRTIKEGQLKPLNMSRKSYLFSFGFLTDVISIIPFDIVFDKAIKYSETLLLLRCLRVRLFFQIIFSNLVYSKFFKVIRDVFHVGFNFVSIFLFGGLLIVFVHIHGCTLFLVGKLLEFKTPAWEPWSFMLTQPIIKQYTWAYFTALSNTFPVTGYRPTDIVEVWASIISVLVGAVLFAVLVGTISSFSFGLDSSGRQFRQKMDEINEYMSHKKLSDPLKERIKQYFDLKYRGKYFDESGIMHELNESLRTEIAKHSSSALIAKVPFLKREKLDGRDELFICRIANALKPVYYINGDTIFEQGRVGHEMFFILSGLVQIIVNNNVVGTLTDGSFFGEVALLGQVPRTATIRAGKPCILYTLDRSAFEPILADFEDMAQHIQQVYQERMQKIFMEREMKMREMEARRGQQVEEINPLKQVGMKKDLLMIEKKT